MSEMSAGELIGSIEEGQRLRGWISNGYAQVEYLLGDIITQAAEMPEYEVTRARLPHRLEKRIAKVREILEIEGIFSAYRDEISSIIAGFEVHHETRNLLAHGFCTAYHTPDGDFGLEFRKWHREGDDDREMRKTFRLVDLEYENAQLTNLSQRALHLTFQIHGALGIVGG